MQRCDLAIDWGDYRKKALVSFDGETVTILRAPLHELVAKLSPAYRTWVLEAPSNSFNLDERTRLLDEAAKHGVTIFAIPSKQTDRFRRKHGLEKEEHALDAKCIFAIANSTNLHLAKLKYPSDAQRARVAARLATPEGRALVARSQQWREDLIEEFVRFLPPDAPDWFKDTAFWKARPTKKDPARGECNVCWCVPVVAAALTVVGDGGTREDFDRKIGAYAFGYPSYLRSNFYFHMVGRAVKSALGVSTSQELKAVDPALVTEARKLLSSAHRRATRWLFTQVKQAAGTFNP